MTKLDTKNNNSLKAGIDLYKQLMVLVFNRKSAVVYPVLSLVVGFVVAAFVSISIRSSLTATEIKALLDGTLPQTGVPVALALGLFAVMTFAGIINLALYQDWQLYWMGLKADPKSLIRQAFKKSMSITFWYTLCIAITLGLGKARGLVMFGWMLTLFVDTLISVRNLSVFDAIVESFKLSMRQWKLVLTGLVAQLLLTNSFQLVLEMLAYLPWMPAMLLTTISMVFFFVYFMILQSAWRVAVILADEQQSFDFMKGQKSVNPFISKLKSYDESNGAGARFETEKESKSSGKLREQDPDGQDNTNEDKITERAF